MKKIVVGLFLMSLLITPIASAAEGDLKAQLRDRLEQKREEIDSKKSDLRERFDDKRTDVREIRVRNIRSFWDRMVKRIESAIERQYKLIERIESRMAELDEDGIDVSDAREKIAEAEEELALAERKLAAATEKLDELFELDNPREIFQEIKELIRETIGHVKSSHKSLSEAIRILKSLVDTE